MNEPDSQGSPLGYLREAAMHLRWLGHDQQAEATPASRKTTAAVPRWH